MPETAAFIDACRETFGAEQINAAIKAGMQGQPTFYAIENGQEVGTPIPEPKNAVSLAEMPRPTPCDGCISLAQKQITPKGDKQQAWCRKYKTTAARKCADWSAR